MNSAPGDGKAAPNADETDAAVRRACDKLGARPIVLIGLMGAGKTAIGKRLATRLAIPFVDADQEIEKAAGKSISEIFGDHGEESFRDGERRVIARLLSEGTKVLATGGGAFMNEETRQRILEKGVSVWLKADLDILMGRVSRRDTRPLLKTADPRKVMERLLAERNPVYAQANITVESRDVLHEVIVDEIVNALAAYPGS
jgi:shikimate kinase